MKSLLGAELKGMTKMLAEGRVHAHDARPSKPQRSIERRQGLLRSY